MEARCRTIREMMLADADGELDSRRQGEMHAHLASCPACRREYEALACTREALRAWETPAVNPQLSVVFAERLAARRARPSPVARLFGWRRAAWAAAMSAVLLFALFASRLDDRERHHVQAPAPHPTTADPGTPDPAPVNRVEEGAPVSPPPPERPVVARREEHRGHRAPERRPAAPDEAPAGAGHAGDAILVEAPTPDAADTLVALLTETGPAPVAEFHRIDMPVSVTSSAPGARLTSRETRPALSVIGYHEAMPESVTSVTRLPDTRVWYADATFAAVEKDAALLIVELWGETH